MLPPGSTFDRSKFPKLQTKKFEEITDEDLETPIVLSGGFRWNRAADHWFDLLKNRGFKRIFYAHRTLWELSIVDRFRYIREYGWNVNASVPVRSKSIRGVPVDLQIYVVTSHFDRHKTRRPLLAPKYSTYIQAGAALTDVQMCELRDDVGEDNISTKNPFYCELTALYWLHKNDFEHEYIGFNLYSRVFAMDDEQLRTALLNGIDVIVAELEILWMSTGAHRLGDYLTQAIRKTHPEYEQTHKAVTEEAVAASSNLFVARKNIFHEYCQWLFDVMSEYESMLNANAVKIPPRHFGYIAEHLITVYFLHNSSKLNILFQRRSFLI